MCATFKETIKPTPPSSIGQFLFTQTLTCTLQYYLQTFKLWFKHSHKPFEIQLKHLITRSKHENSRLKLSVKQVKHFIINIKPLQWHLNVNLKLAVFNSTLTSFNETFILVFKYINHTIMSDAHYSIQTFNSDIQCKHSTRTFNANMQVEHLLWINIQCEHSLQTFHANMKFSNIQFKSSFQIAGFLCFWSASDVWH